MFVFFDIDEITDVPRFPHPIIPIRMTEFRFVPKTMSGLKIKPAETILLFLTKTRLFIVLMIYYSDHPGIERADLHHAYLTNEISIRSKPL
jgi:hypothetical protein